MFHYSKAVLRVGARLLWACLFTFKRWNKKLDKVPFAIRNAYFRKISKKTSDALQVDLHVFGLENIPTDGNFFLVSNHMSAFDPLPFLIALEKPTTFVGKMELENVPLLKAALKSLDVKSMNRDDLRQSLKVMLAVEEDLKKKERNWMIFPEGTRIRDQMLPVAAFHHGTFRPAQKAKVTILPAATYGTFRVLKMHPQFKRYPVSISFLKPITPEEYADLNTSDLAELTRNMVQKEITYHLRPLDHKIMSERKEKAYKFNAIL